MKLINQDAIAIATMWAEARGEPLEGLIAVGEVIRRRAKLKYNCDGTIFGACLRKWQFSCWNEDDPQRYRMLQLDGEDPEVIKCTGAWIQSEFTDYANGAVLYHANYIDFPPWVVNCRKVAEIGVHLFYVELKRRG